MRLNNFQTRSTGAASVAFTAIGNTEVTVICGTYSQFISVNTPATTSSPLFPVNSVTRITINPGDVIHALSHGGAGGIVTLVY
jgi:hypothetical protein